jgi:hypothetical protein
VCVCVCERERERDLERNRWREISRERKIEKLALKIGAERFCVSKRKNRER